jgi:orotidine-5'-phosphate decarboxylase
MPEPFRARLQSAIARAGAPLCVGLDPDPKLLPPHLGVGIAAVREFLDQIIHVTRDSVAAYKPNTAFFEAYGAEGIALLESLRDRIGASSLLIMDAKRGDVEHTNAAYAQALLGRMQADAVTVQPYLGGTPLAPFCADPQRGMFVLCATSNPGAEEVQWLQTPRGPLFLEIARLARSWSAHPNVGLVLGTTKPEAVEAVVEVAPDLPYLLPGGGAQGGDTARIAEILRQHGATGLFTFSRSVLYASQGRDFADAARAEMLRLRGTLNLK